MTELKIVTLLKRTRVSNGVSQNQLGAHLGHSGGQFISNFECGVGPLPLKTLKEIGDYLGIPKTLIIEALLFDYKEELRRAFKD